MKICKMIPSTPLTYPMTNGHHENPLLTAIFDQIGDLISCTHIAVFFVDETDVNLAAYRGPIPATIVPALKFSLKDSFLLSQVHNQRKPLLMRNADSDEPFSVRHRTDVESRAVQPFFYVKSWIGFPLITTAQYEIILDVGNNKNNLYTEEDLKRVAAYLDTVASRIGTAVLSEILFRTINNIKMLWPEQQAILGQPESLDLLQLVTEKARQLSKAIFTSIYLLEGETLISVSRAGEIKGSFDLEYRCPLNDSLIGEVITSGKSLRIPNSKTDTIHNLPAGQVDEPHSLIIVPLTGSRDLLGAIVCIDCEFGSFGSLEEQSLENFSFGAMLALENTRRYREEQNLRRISKGIQGILAQLSSTLPLTEVLDMILSHTAQLFDADAEAMYLLDPRGGVMNLVSSYQINPEIYAQIESPLTWPESAAEAESSEAGGDSLEATILTIRNTDIFHTYTSGLRMQIFLNNSIAGLLDIFWKRPFTFTTQNLQLASSITKYTCLAIERDQLSKKNIELARMQEQHRIAQALHDTVAQYLFRIGLEANWCQQNLPMDPLVQGRIQIIERLVKRTNDELRSAIFALNDHNLGGHHALIDIFKDQVSEFQDETGIQARLFTSNNFDALTLPSPLSEAIFRILREALNNIHKHSHASAVLVSLDEADQKLTLTIQDNGRGLPLEALHQPDERDMHFGIKTIRQLVAQLGGDLFLGNNDDDGAIIKASFSLALKGDQ